MNVKEEQMYSDKSHPKGLYVLFVTEMWSASAIMACVRFLCCL